MPFTPFHMGPALAVKAVADEHFSLITFGLAQLAMDIEPLVRLVRADPVLHGFTHTCIGAILIGGLVGAFGMPVARRVLARWRQELQAARLGWLAGPRHLDWRPAAAGALMGTLSHVALDSLMHADIRPWAPLSAAKGLLGAIPVGELHRVCVLSGIMGTVAWVGRRFAFRARFAHSGRFR